VSSPYKIGDPCLIHSMPADSYHGWDYVAEVVWVREDGSVQAGRRNTEGEIHGTITFDPSGQAEWASGYGPNAPNHAALYTITSKEAYRFYRREAGDALKAYVAGHSVASLPEILDLQTGVNRLLGELLDYATEEARL